MNNTTVSQRLKRRASCVACAVAAVMAATAVHAKPHPAGWLPPQSPKQVEARMKQMLQRMSDLAAYIETIDADGTVVLHAVYPPGSACGASQPKATLGHTVDKERLLLAEHALESINSDIANGIPPRIRLKQGTCLGR